MNFNVILKVMALTSYSLIVLMGQLIGVPFILWLLMTSIDFGNVEQVFAILGIVGFGLNFTSLFTQRKYRVLFFLFMLVPLVKRFTSLYFETFNYLTFILPVGVFIISYLILIVKPIKK